MLLYRRESWGRVGLDLKGDEFWAEVRPDTQAPRIDRPLSATCWLGGSSLSCAARKRRALPGADAWRPIFGALQQAGLLRLNLAGFESIPRSDLQEIVAAGLDRGLAVVVSAVDCTPDLEKCLDLPNEISLQILFDPGRAWRAERSGQLSLARRLEILHQCVVAELRLRVLTPYDPFSPLTLAELGEELALAGLQEWLIFSRPSASARGMRADSAIAEVQALREDFPYLEIRYGAFAERELDLIVRSNGSLRARRGSSVGPARRDTIEHLTQRGWLSDAFMDRHVDLWVSGRLEFCEPDSTSSEFWPEVFLSYNRRDRHLVLPLRDRLEDAGIQTWFDDRIEAGDPFHEVIERALERSSNILFCIGPCGLGAFQKEIEMPAALSLLVNQRARVIPVLLQGLKDESEMPLLLRGLSRIDLRPSPQDDIRRLIQEIRHRGVGEAEPREVSGDDMHPPP